MISITIHTVLLSNNSLCNGSSFGWSRLAEIRLCISWGTCTSCGTKISFSFLGISRRNVLGKTPNFQSSTRAIPIHLHLHIIERRLSANRLCNAASNAGEVNEV